jgi:GDPmannose 4,6-dehydratase
MVSGLLGERVRALIIGISGQDGAYLAQLLLGKGYEVFGTSRDSTLNPFGSLARLGLRERVTLLSTSPVDFRSVITALTKANPDEVYNLSGQSSVGLSFDQPVETMESICIGTLNLLEAIRFTGKPIRLYNSGSGESFGNTGGRPADEETAFRPRSPYAVAKAAAHFEVANYREAYGLFACSGILFNHESPLRPERFVTRKIVAAAARISRGSEEQLRLGNMDISRDWGWAPDYVDAMWRMLRADRPDDFVIATGQTRSLRDFVDAAFRAVGLDWHDHVAVDQALMRPSDLGGNFANPAKAERALGWRAQVGMDELVRRMIAAELESPATATFLGPPG